MKKSQGKGIGIGHGSNSNLPVIREKPNDPQMELWIEQGLMQPGTKSYKMGKCKIYISPPYLQMGWHMSISTNDRYPTWDEIAKARYELLPKNITVVMILPPPEEYINIHNFCFQLHEELKP